MSGAIVRPSQHLAGDDVHYDTTGLRLARWDCGLRFERGLGWVVTIPVPSKAEILDRTEVLFDAPPDRPPPRAVSLVRSLTRGEPVMSVPIVDLARSDRPNVLPEVPTPVVPTDPTARDVIRAAFARSVRRLLLHLPAARVGHDIGGVHQARVATRRLRSDLKTFRPLLDPEWAKRLGFEVKWLTKDLGKIRDADVVLALLRSTILDHPELEAESRPLIELLVEERRQANKALVKHLNRRRTDRLLDELIAAAVDPPTTPEADGDAVERLRAPVRKRWTRLQHAVEALDTDSSIEDLHRVRILAKQTRYAAEAVTPAFGAEANTFASSISGLQDVLGSLNDAAVTASWVEAAGETKGGSAASAATKLANAVGARNDELRDVWSAHYVKATWEENQAWLQ